jgi:hypothetical protein
MEILMYKTFPLKLTIKIPTVVITGLLLTACQSQHAAHHQQTNAQYQFADMLAKAEDCIAQQNDSKQCYQQAFPRRCRNFTNDMNSERATTQQKLNNCVSACQQAPIASRSIGACSVIL